MTEVNSYKRQNRDIGALAELSMEYFYFELTAEG
jgi:hypothetical protein